VGESQVSLQGTAGFLTPGNPQSPALLSGNDASSGGGVSISGANTLFHAVDTVIAANTAGSAAAISSRSGAEFIIERDPDTDCRRFESPVSPAPCSRIRDNISQGIYMINIEGDGATGRISQTFIHGNQSIDNLIRTDSQPGRTPSELEIEGSVIFDNDTTRLFEVWDNADLRVLWSTIAENDLDDRSAVFQTFGSNQTGGQRIVYGSIIYQPGIPMYDGQSDSFFFSCSIADDLGFPGQISQSLAADPMFIDSAAENYHIDPDSPAVDFCAKGIWPPQDPDMDGENRGISAGALSTPFDAGADEALDLLFSDRFEG